MNCGGWPGNRQLTGGNRENRGAIVLFLRFLCYLLFILLAACLLNPREMFDVFICRSPCLSSVRCHHGRSCLYAGCCAGKCGWKKAVCHRASWWCGPIAEGRHGRGCGGVVSKGAGDRPGGAEEGWNKPGRRRT